MRPIVYSNETPRSISDFAVDWPSAVHVFALVREGELAYVDAAARYCNNGGIPGGIFGLRLLLREDAELDRLLSLAHALPSVAKDLVPYLLARTTARAALRGFDDDPAALEEKLSKADFTLIDSFTLEGRLASYLFRYGMYGHYYDDHTAEDAASCARALLRDSTSFLLEQIIAFETGHAWGAWFDVHSCTDRTFVIIDRSLRRATLLAFSHSD